MGLLYSPAHENLTISVRSDRGMNPSPILPILLTCVRFGQHHRGAFLHEPISFGNSSCSARFRFA